MSEDEWLACADPIPMLNFLRGKLSDRKLRLFACACCDSVRRFIPAGPCRDVLDISFRYAEGQVTADELAATRALAIAVADRIGPHTAAAWAACGSADPSAIRAARAAAQEAREQIRRLSPRASEDEARAQAEFLRDIVGNPFRSVTAESFQWLGSYPVLREIAEGVYEGAPQEDMLSLADELEQLGCPNEAVLKHCRSSEQHVRGCWVIELILANGQPKLSEAQEPLSRAKMISSEARESVSRAKEIRAALAYYLGPKKYRRFLRNALESPPGAGLVHRPPAWDAFVAQHPQYTLPDADLAAVFAVCPVHEHDLIERIVRGLLSDDPLLLRDPRFLEARGTQFPHSYPEEGMGPVAERLGWWCLECQQSRAQWLAGRFEPRVEPLPSITVHALEPVSEPLIESPIQPVVLMLEDDSDRVQRFIATLRAIDSSMTLRVWSNARVMIQEIGPLLTRARVISLDHDLESGNGSDPGDGMDVARYLVTLPIICPVIIHSSNGARADWMAGEFELAGWPHWRIAPLGDDWIEVDWSGLLRRLLRMDPLGENMTEVNWPEVVERVLQKSDKTPNYDPLPSPVEPSGSMVPRCEWAERLPAAVGQLASLLSLAVFRVGAGRLGAESVGNGPQVLAWWWVSVEPEIAPPWLIGAVHESEAGDEDSVQITIRGFMTDTDEAAVATLGADEVMEALGTLNPFRIEATTRIATSGDEVDPTDTLRYSLRWGTRTTAGSFEFSNPQEDWLAEFERVLFRFVRQVVTAAGSRRFEEYLGRWLDARAGVLTDS